MRFAILAAALVAATPVFSQDAGHAGHAMPAPAAEGPAAQALSAVNDSMMQDMTIAFTGNPDRDFILMMIPHHQGAIDMARVQLEYGQDPAIRKLAEEIIAAQEIEIAEMKAWLEANPE